MDRRSRLKYIFGYALAVAGLIWVLHDVNARRLAEAATVHNWGWVLLAIAADTGSYICQALRWRMLLASSGEISTLRTAQAIYVGLLVNEIVPLRFGELVRAYLVSRWLSLRMRNVIPSMAVERIMDAAWLALAAGVAAAFVPLPAGLAGIAETLGFILIAGTVLLFFFARDSLRKMQPSKRFAPALAISFSVLVLQALAFCMAIRAYDLPVPFSTGAVVFLIVHLGTAIPNAPANVGAFQFFTVLALTFFGVEKTAATGFSIGAFLRRK
jgi:uncharacterized membrane protein YbhN (UPF0104 family)